MSIRILPLLLVSLLIRAFCFLNTVHAANCGDADASGQIDITDAVYLINYIFADGPTPQDEAAGDFDCNDQTDITDAVFMINYIFASGPVPCGGQNCGTGVLLTGDAGAGATTALYKFGPIAAAPADVDSTHLIKTRIEAVLSPTATIGEVNAALAAINGRISWMLADGLWLTVAIPAVAKQQQADSLGALLVGSGAFLFAYAAFQPDLNSQASMQELPPTGVGEIFHLLKMRMPAVWNLRKMAEDLNANVTVFVPDGYYNTTPHPEIAAQVFVTGEGNPELISTTEGNHGFRTSGIVGANHDDKNTTGVHPNWGNALTIRSMPIGGLTLPEISSEIVDNMPPGRFVLNTSFGFSKDISDFSKAKRAVQALNWRRLARLRKDDFIHVSSAGNDGANTDDSRYAVFGSAFNVAAAFGSPFEMYAPGEIGPIDNVALQILWAYTLSQSPFNANKMDNLIVVGSSDVNGAESWFSSRGSFVRVLGEGVAGACVRNDPAGVDGGCFETGDGFHISYYDGTSFAAPQVAGLAAVMLSLKPDLSNTEIYHAIYYAYANSANSGFVDAYGAVMGLDEWLGEAPIRSMLLDVANAIDQESPDGVFDEHDLMMFLTKFTEYEQLRAGVPNAPADYSRYDLNGDGFTGGDYATQFDLDINTPPAFTSFVQVLQNGTHHFDEHTIRDADALCYYANTFMYSGANLDLRDSLLVAIGCPVCNGAKNSPNDCNELWVLDIDFPAAVFSSEALTVRVGRIEDTGTVWVPNIEVDFAVTGGSVAPASGITNGSGGVTTTATIDSTASAIDIVITASELGVVVATGTAHAVKAGIVTVFDRQTGINLIGLPPGDFTPFSYTDSQSDVVDNADIGASGSASAVGTHFSSFTQIEDSGIFVFTIGGVNTSSANIGQSCSPENPGAGVSAGIVGTTTWWFEIYGEQEVPFTFHVTSNFTNNHTFGSFGGGYGSTDLRAWPSGGFIINIVGGLGNEAVDTTITGSLSPGKYFMSGNCNAYADAATSPPTVCGGSASASTSMNSVLTFFTTPAAMKRNLRKDEASIRPVDARFEK